jgi:hypothetical protein
MLWLGGVVIIIFVEESVDGQATPDASRGQSPLR